MTLLIPTEPLAGSTDNFGGLLLFRLFFVVSEARIIPQELLCSKPTPTLIAVSPSSLVGISQVNTTLVITLDTFPVQMSWDIRYDNDG